MAPNSSSRRRLRPNILITGTPGTGKTTTASALADAAQLRHINIGDLVKVKNLHDGWDDELDCFIINEDLVCDELEDMMEQGGNIIDYHGCDFFPERWFDRVVVLQTENSFLFDRLKQRGYSDAKLSNNIECEIFQVLLEEAKESYREEIVFALTNNSIEDIARNVETLANWVSSWNSTLSMSASTTASRAPWSQQSTKWSSLVP
ncbi:unnamed protein product [Cuscuta epithymum]|uniref:Adenylate kinase isoenzyme 6 homolog n=1 Tax=Cuscuta epithymum TaxID=186058 RepID=A0AAV0EJW5_9ASTE|nr:unnamed protein product [Cuscuta epithymum]CAH9123008.1 unnamed protein product [Cuscuta epithymum]